MGGLWLMYGWSIGGVYVVMVHRWCMGCVKVVYRWCIGDSLVVFECYMDGV